LATQHLPEQTRISSNFGKIAFAQTAPNAWNNLLLGIKSSTSYQMWSLKLTYSAAYPTALPIERLLAPQILLG